MLSVQPDGELRDQAVSSSPGLLTIPSHMPFLAHKWLERYLKQPGYINKLDIWVSHKFNEIQLTKRIFIYDSLLKRKETDPFLKRIITGDKK